MWRAVACLLAGCSFDHGVVPGGPRPDGQTPDDGPSIDMQMPIAPAPMRAWHGELHRIVVYSRHMTSSEVTALYAAGL